ncbi:MAG TPA: DeoR/GlpR transcriptional regulator [Verrucomicrobiales bacterium]|nr:DeoR/GlpR transcriptional regulator [Verrucomicrobiales bacterium]
MTAEERQFRLEEHLKKVEFASLAELSELVDVSESTVRRDLQILEGKGTLQRTHGGARSINLRSDEYIFSKRDTLQADEKDAIGKACADLIGPGQTVILDAGTTVFHVAKHLASKKPHIVTNSLPVANLYASNHELEVVVSGGVIYPRLGVLVGPIAVETFSKIHADVAILSGAGITEEGISNSHGLLIDIQKAMLANAQKIIFCLDHTKFGRKSFSPLCDLNVIDTVVTDAQTPEPMLEMLRGRDIRVVVGS